MNLAAQRLQALLPRHLWAGSGLEPTAALLPFDTNALALALPEGGLIRGAVTEFATKTQGTLATSLGLLACRAGQYFRGECSREERCREVRGFERGEKRWCAFVDFGAALHAPRVAQLGVDLKRFLVVRPCAKTLLRCVLTLAEAAIFSVIVADVTLPMGGNSGALNCDWVKFVRKLSVVLTPLETSLILITDESVRHALPLPVATRIEFRQTRTDFEVQVVKDKYGRLTPTRALEFAQVA